MTGPTRTGVEALGWDGGLLTPAEVAALFRVGPRTVTRWARAGRLSSVRTPGGHRRYPAAQFTLAPATTATTTTTAAAAGGTR